MFHSVILNSTTNIPFRFRPTIDDEITRRKFGSFVSKIIRGNDSDGSQEAVDVASNSLWCILLILPVLLSFLYFASLIFGTTFLHTDLLGQLCTFFSSDELTYFIWLWIVFETLKLLIIFSLSSVTNLAPLPDKGIRKPWNRRQFRFFFPLQQTKNQAPSS